MQLKLVTLYIPGSGCSLCGESKLFRYLASAAVNFLYFEKQIFVAAFLVYLMGFTLEYFLVFRRFLNLFVMLT